MNLLPVSFNSNLQNKNLSFESKTTRVYKELKDVPGLKCGCCGREVLSAIKLQKAYQAVSKSLSTILDRGGFQFLKTNYTKAYDFIQQLAIENPDKNLDKILTENQQAHKYLTSLIYTNQGKKQTPQEARKQSKPPGEIYTRIRRHGRYYMKSSSVVMKRFASLKKYLDGEKLKTFEQLERYADMYPRKSLSEIINLKEVYEYHKLKSRLEIGELCEKRRYRFNRIQNLIKKTNPDAAEYFKELQTDAIHLSGETNDPAARIPKLKQLYAAALKEHGCEKVQDKVFAELEQIPVIYVNKDSFLAFAKEHNYSDAAIMESLFSPIMGSEEHVLAISKGGKDVPGNKMIFCRQCNLNRGNDSYAQTVQYHPRMLYFMQKQVKDVSKLILSGNMHERYNFWPIQIKKSIEDVSEGKIKINTDKFIEKQAEHSSARLNGYIGKKEQISTQIETLKAELQALEQETGNINQQIKKENNFRYQLSHITKKSKKN